MRIHDLRSAPLGGAPVEDLALLDQVVHGPHHFLDGHEGIRTMAVEQVQIVQLHALQRVMAGLKQVLAAEAMLVGLVVFAAQAEIGLGRDHE